MVLVMCRFSRSGLPDHVLLRQSRAHALTERAATAELIADLAEIEARDLFASAAYPSMFAWCMGELHLSEDATYKRLQAARAARRHPEILEALADGRLHLSAVVMLAPKLGSDNAADLISAATHKSKAQIELLLAERFPRQDLPALVRPIVAPLTVTPPPTTELRVAPITASATLDDTRFTSLVPEPVRSEISQRVAAIPEPVPAERTKPTPLSPQRYGMQFTIDQEAYDDLRAVQALLGHAVAPGDVASVFARAVQLLRRDLERRRCAATERPRKTGPRRSSNPRHVPNAVRRQVWERDGHRCTFVGNNGRRCEERANLELDHVTPVARGGTATVSGLRLRCRKHNQLEADRVFGRRFMEGKREKGGSRD